MLYYKPVEENPENLKLMRMMDEEYLEHPTKGVLGMVDFLRDLGILIGPKRIRRLLRKMGVMAIYPKRNLSKLGLAKYIHSYKLRGLEVTHSNQIEGKFGQGKNGYNLNQIRAKLSSTSMSWIAAIIFVMNIIRYCRDFPGFLLKWIIANVMKMREQIILTMMPNQRNMG
jgi:hypothetical protein